MTLTTGCQRKPKPKGWFGANGQFYPDHAIRNRVRKQKQLAIKNGTFKPKPRPRQRDKSSQLHQGWINSRGHFTSYGPDPVPDLLATRPCCNPVKVSTDD